MILNRLKNELSLFWVLQFVGWGIYGLINYVSMRPHYQSTKNLMIVLLIFHSTGFGLTLILRRFYKLIRSKPFSFLSIALIVIACSVVGGSIWLGFTKLFSWICLLDPGAAKKMDLFKDLPKWLLYLIGSVNLSFILFMWSALYFGIKYWQDLQKQKEQTLRATGLAHQAQLQMLRYQLNPHFLFNALNSIRAMIDEDHKRAKKMVTELSEFLRYSLLNTNVSEVSLRDEIEAIRNYFAIEKIRFEDRLDVTFDIDQSAEKYDVPGFLIHPLVENAVKYGMQTSPMPLKIKLTVYARNGSLHVEVANTGRWIQPSGNNSTQHNSTGIGLQNVQQRLNQTFPENHRFDIFERDGWVHAVMKIDKM